MNILFVKLLTLALLLAGGAALADPPARVGGIAYLEGAVDFRPLYDGEATPALQNWPLTSGNVITTGPGARAELRVGSTAIRLDGDTELEIAELDDQHLRLRLLQGSVNGRVKNPDLAPGFELSTAQGRLTLTAPSQFHAEAGRRPETSVVDLFTGAGRFESGTDHAQSVLTLVAGQRAIITRDQLQVGVAERDAFDAWSLARDQRDDQSVSARYVSAELTGHEALDDYGAWSMSDDYGAVWIPQSVPAGWAPYRDGRWTWIAPWGWTWVDSAPWGYAPSHYGRWAWYRQRWCWVPGHTVARPVWAPALVGWVGGDHWRVRFSSGSAPAVGWFPLAPQEAFRPGYAASPGYVRQINLHHTRNPEQRETYRRRLAYDAVTVLPHERFQQRRTITTSRAPTLVGGPRQLDSAPLSAAVPATIARPPAPRALREWRRGLPDSRELTRHPSWTPAPGINRPPATIAPAPAVPATPPARHFRLPSGSPPDFQRHSQPAQRMPTPAPATGAPSARERILIVPPAHPGAGRAPSRAPSSSATAMEPPLIGRGPTRHANGPARPAGSAHLQRENRGERAARPESGQFQHQGRRHEGRSGGERLHGSGTGNR